MINSIPFVICEMMLFIEVLMTRIDNHSFNVCFFLGGKRKLLTGTREDYKIGIQGNYMT